MDLPLPENSSYFITSDAGYCHVLPDRIILTSHADYKELPPSEDKKSTATLILGGIGVTFGCYLMVNFLIVGIYLMVVLFFVGMFFATKALAEVARYSAILNVPRDKIQDVRVFQPTFGYIYILIRFRNDKGGTSTRKIRFYDSKQNELSALHILKREGLIV